MVRMVDACLDIDAEYWRARARAKVAFETAKSDSERTKATSALADAAKEAVGKYPESVRPLPKGWSAFVDWPRPGTAHTPRLFWAGGGL